MKFKTFIKETMHLRRSMSGVSLDFGWGNGYVCIPNWHPFYGLGYDDIHDIAEISINGGLTFSSHAKDIANWPELPKDCTDHWVIGFDTAHYRDTLLEWPINAVQLAADNLALQISSLNIIVLWYRRIKLLFLKWIHNKTA